jgi:hypothetical protein
VTGFDPTLQLSPPLNSLKCLRYTLCKHSYISQLPSFFLSFFLSFFFEVLVFELKACTLSHSTSPFL